ncbi:hypothetical protein LH464_14630 [Neorhizobium sp. T786]|uniref:DUF6894 family protein n=1 Tax=Pseudorhizobium xiangyangii TaxID=2883104 RepID=UPI001CFFFA90|nr:hypothetical protein [Neorhizobium xiangyangii]MCB5203712.1 hypothetical protein [Neorhizobium xiangyangii]
MLKYYYHIREGGNLDRDETGVEFETLDQAYEEAMRAAVEMALARDGLCLDDDRVFEITSPEGVILREVAFRDMFRVK